MRRTLLGIGLAGSVVLAPLTRAAVQAEMSSSRPVSGEEMSEIRSYSDRLGKDLLKKGLGLDLDLLAVELDPTRWAFRRPKAAQHANESMPGLGQGPAPGLNSYLRLRLEQSNDLRNLQRGLQEIPFGLSVDAQLPLLASLTALETRLWVPFSWREEFRARATLPLLEPLGGRKLTLRSDFRTQLGFNRLEAGLGTAVVTETLGPWDVDYGFQNNFGQGASEAIHWLKFSRNF